ncbi:GNAT family N-acetyltransferase [Paenibacillus glacialis]|uniref:GCN5 family acetyltransferase n=1 Tax=Paenibacillus glacialis TaxID=494026 RepID=A0A162K6I4_9BACL|nr:GNAT family protein [Paenibacillus glacialis]OAB43726.1 GCN5 family acetyltransferase [Paenibacillus glacialis]
MKVEDIFKDLPVLETSRTILRKIEKNDVQDIYSYCNDKEVSNYTTWDAHKKLEDTEGFVNFVIDRYSKSQLSPWGIQDKNTEKIIGTCDFVNWNIDNYRAEIGYALSREYWGQGYMTECVKRLIEFGFKNMDLVRIEARCVLMNIGSSRVMEKSGMELEGTLRKHILIKGKFEDVKIYSIIKEDSVRLFEEDLAIR